MPGGSTGIGRQLTVDLLSPGAQVMACARNAGALTALVDAPPGILTQMRDVCREEDVDALQAVASCAFGEVDPRVSNAAIIQLLDLPYDAMPVDA